MLMLWRCVKSYNVAVAKARDWFIFFVKRGETDEALAQ